jgi:hypothetical protein
MMRCLTLIEEERPTEYAENAELLKTEIDAAGINTFDRPLL